MRVSDKKVQFYLGDELVKTHIRRPGSADQLESRSRTYHRHLGTLPVRGAIASSIGRPRSYLAISAEAAPTALSRDADEFGLRDFAYSGANRPPVPM